MQLEALVDGEWTALMCIPLQVKTLVDAASLGKEYVDSDTDFNDDATRQKITDAQNEPTSGMFLLCNEIGE